MGFLKKIWKPLAKFGASFIPGVGGFIGQGIDALGGGGGLLQGMGGPQGILGSLLGAYGASGGQGGMDMNSTTIQNLLQNMSRSESGQMQETEDPLMSAFRKTLFQPAQDYLEAASAPVYGDETKANFLNQQNDLYRQAGENLRTQMAARGLTDAGATDIGLGDIEMSRAGQTSQFMANLPFMEREARLKNMGGALGLLTNWAGRGPMGRTFSGETTGSTTTQGTNTTQQTQTQRGPGFLKSLGQIGGGMLMGSAADRMRQQRQAAPSSAAFESAVQQLPYVTRPSTDMWTRGGGFDFRRGY